MKVTSVLAPPLHDRRARVAIDLGAESCRVSLLRWHGDSPEIRLIHRLPNGPHTQGDHLFWPLDQILLGIEDGLRLAASAAPEGIASIAVDGWAVDYVRLTPGNSPLHPPFCYRDERTNAAKAHVDSIFTAEDLFAQTGAQPLRINTMYQLLADQFSGIPASTPWTLLPEFVLSWLGGRRVAEYTNATHTGLIDLATGDWSPTLFARLGLNLAAAPPIVPAGTDLGKLAGPLAALPAFSETRLIAPACHDTASAIAAVTENLDHTAYIVSGTWSLLGTVLATPIPSPQALHAGFTNQGAACGSTCFHTNINGMWLLKQCIDGWTIRGRHIDMPGLVAHAAQGTDSPARIPVDAPRLLLAGEMPARINQELIDQGLEPIPDLPGNEPLFARLIFRSLAARYGIVLRDLEALTERKFHHITILGGGSRNSLLTDFTRQETGLPVSIGEAEGSTLGNFAVQLASSSTANPAQPTQRNIRYWAQILAASTNRPR